MAAQYYYETSVELVDGSYIDDNFGTLGLEEAIEYARTMSGAGFVKQVVLYRRATAGIDEPIATWTDGRQSLSNSTIRFEQSR